MPATSNPPAEILVPLDERYFQTSEMPILEMGDFTASTFRYASGIAAIRIRSPRVEIIVLPFMGQQVWRASFDGHDASMLSMFDEPRTTDQFLETYGAFFIHCGLTGMGAPGPQDNHPLHGELPLAKFTNPRLHCDPVAGRIKLLGTYRHSVAFSTNYEVTTSVSLEAREADAEIGIEVQNLRDKTLDLLYLGHANFRPIEGSNLVYSAHYTPEEVAIRKSIPSHIKPSESYLETLDRLAIDPTLHHSISPELICDPELVFALKMLPDTNGWAHALQVHPEGTADYISYDTTSLPMAIRWLCRTGDQQGLGLALPSTSGVEGYSVEKSAGRFVCVAPKAVWQANIKVGRLSSSDASSMMHKIEQICGRI